MNNECGLEIQRCANMPDDDPGRFGRVDHQRIGRFFQDGTLTGQQRLAHEMAGAMGETLLEQAAAGFEVDDCDVVTIPLQNGRAIGGFKQRAGQHHRLLAVDPIADGRMNFGKPRPAVLIRERNAPAELFDMFR